MPKGVGEGAGGVRGEINYEGYAPGGGAMLVEGATDNRSRTVAEVRHIFTKNGGSMGEVGPVNWMFNQKGVLRFDKNRYGEEQLMEIGLEAGAEDIVDEGDFWEVHCLPGDFDGLRQAFEDAGIEAESAEISMLPQNSIAVDAETGRKLLRMVEAFEDNDDVQQVHSNFDLPDEVLEEM